MEKKYIKTFEEPRSIQEKALPIRQLTKLVQMNKVNEELSTSLDGMLYETKKERRIFRADQQLTRLINKQAFVPIFCYIPSMDSNFQKTLKEYELNPVNAEIVKYPEMGEIWALANRLSFFIDAPVFNPKQSFNSDANYFLRVTLNGRLQGALIVPEVNLEDPMFNEYIY